MASASIEAKGKTVGNNVKDLNVTVYPDMIEDRRKDFEGRAVTHKYQRGKLLGKGGFAKCFVGTLLPSKVLYALKIVAKSSLTKSRAKQKLQTEIKIHKTLAHAHVVRFDRFFEDPTFAYIVLELCTNNSMSELLKRRKRLSEFEVKYYLSQLVNALVYLHQNCIIHRDLKLGNLFISADMQVKVGDFGLATRVNHIDEKKRTVCGTPNYIAPEILDSKEGHSYEVDIWSTGVVVYTLLVGKPPFESKNVHATYKRILANAYCFPFEPELSESARSIIRGILVQAPEARPLLPDILSHPFLHPISAIPSTIPTYLLREPLATTSGVKAMNVRVTDENDPTALNNDHHASNAKLSHPNAPEKRPYAIDINNPAAEKRPFIDLLGRDPKLRAISSSAGKKPAARPSLSVPRQETAIAPSKLLPTTKSRPLASSSLKFEVYSDPKPVPSRRESIPARSTAVLSGERSRGSAGSSSKPSKSSVLSILTPHALVREVIEKNDVEDLKDIHIDMNNVKLEDKNSGVMQRRRDDGEAWTDNDDIIPTGDSANKPSVVARQIEIRTPKLGSSCVNNREINTIEQMYGTLSDGLAQGHINKNTENTIPSNSASIWVSRYVDYTSKYGLGFLLNNGSTGVYFNDSTKIVLSPDGAMFQYIERKRSVGNGSDHSCETHSLSSYPPELHKKVTLLKHFGSYLVDQEKEDKTGKDIKLPSYAVALDGATSAAINKHSDERYDATAVLPYLKKWVRTRHAILFRLSNKTVQVVFFDKSEVLLSSEAHMVTFVDKNGQRSEHFLQDVLLTGRVDIAKRLKCTKDIMYRLMTMQPK